MFSTSRWHLKQFSEGIPSRLHLLSLLQRQRSIPGERSGEGKGIGLWKNRSEINGSSCLNLSQQGVTHLLHKLWRFMFVLDASNLCFWIRDYLYILHIAESLLLIAGCLGCQCKTLGKLVVAASGPMHDHLIMLSPCSKLLHLWRRPCTGYTWKHMSQNMLDIHMNQNSLSIFQYIVFAQAQIP